MRPVHVLSVALTVVIASACPRALDEPIDADAGIFVDAGAVVDAGAGVVVDDAGIVALPLAPSPLEFRFVRMRTPTAGGEEIVRIGLHERVRLVDGVVVEERAAPAAEALARLVAQCASRDVERALRAPGDTAPSMTLIELGCAPVQGVVACEPGANASSCAGAFAALRDVVTAAWQEDGTATRAPSEGIVVRTTSWQPERAPAPSAATLLLFVDGKALLPSKGEPFARAPKGKRAILCRDGMPHACTDVVAPALVHLEIIEATHRFRCPSCAPAVSPMLPRVDVEPSRDVALHGNDDVALNKTQILTVMKRDAMPRVSKECARAAGADTVKVSFTIEPAGHVNNARDTAAQPTARGRCAASVIGRLKFPPSSTSTPVTFPFKIGR